MRKFLSIMTVAIFFVTTSLTALAHNPCKPIAKACVKAGYYQGGHRVGRGLVENCMFPVVNKRKVLYHTSFSDRTLYHCKKMMIEKARNYR